MALKKTQKYHHHRLGNNFYSNVLFTVEVVKARRSIQVKLCDSKNRYATVHELQQKSKKTKKNKVGKLPPQ